MMETLTRFEASLDPARPPQGAQVIGYGEISAVFAVDGLPGVVVKRMVGFADAARVEAYRALVARYCELLAARGVDVVDTRTVAVETGGRHVAYVIQPRLPAAAVGDAVLGRVDEPELRRFLRAILARVRAVFAADTDTLALGLDAQISNWAWLDGRPVLLDVSTPIVREHGRQLMDPDLVLGSMPRPVAWVFARVALPTLLERYHNARLVAQDLVANFHKEGQIARIPAALEEINAWLAETGDAPLAARGVAKAYAQDARLWTAFQAMRRFDRAVTTKLLRRRYDHVLPPSTPRTPPASPPPSSGA